MLLLLPGHPPSVLATLEPNHLLAVHLGGLKGLQLTQLHRTKLLARVQLRHHHLSRQLDERGLAAAVLEPAHGGHGLVHRAARAMTGLEALWPVGGLFLALALALGPPVALKIARACPRVTPAARGAATTTNRHALASAVAAAATCLCLGRRTVSGSRLRRRLVLFAASLIRGGIRAGELETGCRAFLLSEFSSLLRVCECKGVSSLVTAATATSATTGLRVLPSTVRHRGLEMAEATTRRPRGWSGRGPHTHIRNCRLVTAV